MTTALASNVITAFTTPQPERNTAAMEAQPLRRALRATVTLANGQRVQARGQILGPKGAPAVIVLGGVSANDQLCPCFDDTGWWPGIAGIGKALCPNAYQLLSVCFLGEEVRPFPTLDDQAQAIIALADQAGLDNFALIGASYGGTIAMTIAAQHPARVTSLKVLSAAARPHPMITAWRSIQRETVKMARDLGAPEQGVDLARRLAMTTYRTPDEFKDRFLDPQPGSRDEAGIEAYLEARGKAYAQKTSAERFLALSYSMDSANVAVENITAPTQFFAVDEDRLAPPEDIADTAARMANARITHHSSLYGHDAFLKDIEAVTRFLTE